MSNPKNRQSKDFSQFSQILLSPATCSGLVVINMTKNSEKSRATQKIVRLTIFRNTRKATIFAAACKPGQKCIWKGKDKVKRSALISDIEDGGLKAPHLNSIIETQRVLCCQKLHGK